MFTFYIKTALRNIINNKRQAIIFSLGVIFSTAIFLGLAIWSTTAKNLASEDFLEAQDFEIKIRSYDPEFIPAIENWLNNESLVESTSELFYNIALFNAESKNDSYRFFPEDQQDNLTDPISLTNLCLFSN
ncbi:MAG: hypothetical protein U9O98_04805, partial [Asgard group archaeon]|nr:hypothetical protein [Asgard group archaeon]